MYIQLLPYCLPACALLSGMFTNCTVSMNVNCHCIIVYVVQQEDGYSVDEGILKMEY